MADAAGPLSAIAALEGVEAFLTHHGARALTAAEIARFGNRFDRGWRLPVAFDNMPSCQLDVLFPANFPYSLPRLAIVEGAALLEWPHLEENGLLCIYDEGSSGAVERPLDIVQALIHEGIELIEKCLAGSNTDDFRREFLSYWGRSDVVDRPRLVNLLDPGGPHRKVVVWTGTEQHVVDENEARLIGWLKNAGMKPAKSGKYTIVPALLLWAPQVPLPKDYPRSGADLIKLFGGDKAAAELLGSFAASGHLDTDILMGVRSATGVGFGGLRPSKPRAVGAPGRKVDPIQKGFRPGHVPPAIALLRALPSTTAVTKVEVTRADHSWIHGRDRDARQEQLRKQHVIMVGCGSLGSGVAETLARSGVGNLTLVDSDVLNWENLSRHVLGASSIKQSKAECLAAKLRRDLPHLPGIVSMPLRLTRDDEATWELMSKADLIVSTTGHWGTDALLDAFRLNGSISRVLYGWLEPHASAAHSLILDSNGGCLRCGFSETGAHLMRVTDWPDRGLQAVPACGGTFSPYGAADLTYAVALVTNAVLSALVNDREAAPHQIWIGDSNRWQANGGHLSGAWLEAYGDPGRGRLIIERDWPHRDGCHMCPPKVAAA